MCGTSGFSDLKQAEIRARAEANFWKSAFNHLKEKCRELVAMVKAQQKKLAEQAGQINALRAKNEELEAQIRWLRRNHFGPNSEASVPNASPGKATAPQPAGSPQPDAAPAPAAAQRPEPPAKRKRGQQPGTRGHGRTNHDNLPAQEHVCDFPEGPPRCPVCGLTARESGWTEDSEEIDWEVRIVKKRHKRKVYICDCECAGRRRFLTAPAPAKPIPKGKFTSQFWARVIVEKYLHQRPLNRVRQALAGEGLRVSAGTLADGLRRIGGLLQPLFDEFVRRCQESKLKLMDETRWMVWTAAQPGRLRRWWLWVVASAEAVVYLLDPTRSAEVPRRFLGEDPEGDIVSDCYAVYDKLGKKIRNHRCWAHHRRAFLDAGRDVPRLAEWAEGWKTEIDGLFRINRLRTEARARGDAAGFAEFQQQLSAGIAAMKERLGRDLARTDLAPRSRKPLLRLKKYWEQSVGFAADPDIPMDNNEAERLLRNPATGRHTYRGSGSAGAGHLAAVMFTVLATYVKNGIPPLAAVRSYLEACAANGGRAPADLDPFVPWRMSRERREQLAPPRAAVVRTGTYG